VTEPVDLEHVRVMRVRPGDTIILTVPKDATPADAAQMMARMQDTWPVNKCVVLTDDTELSVVALDPHALDKLIQQRARILGW